MVLCPVEEVHGLQNPRNRENILKRGRILSRDGKLIAYTTKKGKRVYPQGEAFEPLVGYVSEKYGKSGLEKYLDKYLKSGKANSFWDYVMRIKPRGEDVYLTIDESLQKLAYESLKNKKGAVVILNPKNGEVLALASSPSFDVKSLNSKWNQYAKSSSSPFILRPVQGIYPPGSVFKLFTYATALEENVITPYEHFHCNGDFPIKYSLGTYHVKDAGGIAHGDITSLQALAYSCNVTFARIGLEIGADTFYEYANKFGITNPPEFVIPIAKPSFPSKDELKRKTLLAQSAFGQGNIALAPIQVALITSAFANNGEICYPHLIKARYNGNKMVYQCKKQVWKTPIDKDTAQKVKEAMVSVVEYGTGRRAKIEGVKVAGKTGSAENSSGNTHAWFTCFAPANNPKFLVVVIVENGGAGGRVASPIARKILLKALNLINDISCWGGKPF